MYSKEKKIKKIILLAFKIGLGSSVAIAIASMLGLEQVAPAGTIALLTLMSTKWDTVRLSVYRILSFFIAVLLSIVRVPSRSSVKKPLLSNARYTAGLLTSARHSR